jgi:hypothetical protein
MALRHHRFPGANFPGFRDPGNQYLFDQSHFQVIEAPGEKIDDRVGQQTGVPNTIASAFAILGPFHS